MKYLFLVLSLSILSNGISQNSIGYQYDTNGNRTQRYFIGMYLRLNPNTSSADSTKALEESKQTALQHGLSVYPNPTKDAVSVSINNANKTSVEDKNAIVYLMDMSGKILAEQKYNGNENTFDMSNLLAGNYYIRVVFNKNENVYYKIIKVN